MKKTLFILCISGLLLTACQKPKPKPAPEPEETPVTTDLQEGIPTSLVVNGYLYANANSPAGSGNVSVRCHAVFSDPTRSLPGGFDHYNNVERQRLGNISVGDVVFNGEFLNEFNNETDLSYNLFTNSFTFSYEASWNSQGNGTFKPLQQELPRGFPRINSSAIPLSLKRSENLVFNASALCTSYDSLVVMLTGLGGSSSPRLRKAIFKSEAQLVFTSAELSSFLSSNQLSTQCQVFGFNYAHRMIENKSYLFELSDKIFRTISVTQ